MDGAFPLLETDRLWLREITDGDASGLFALYSDPRVVEYYDIEPFTEESQAAVLVRGLADKYHDGVGIRWGISLKSAPATLIGTCSYTWNPDNASALLGYDLLSERWGQGIMREAVYAALRYGFEVRSLNRIQAMTSLDNVASIRLLRGLGFTEEGVLRQLGFWKGEFHDMRCFSLLWREWPESILP